MFNESIFLPADLWEFEWYNTESDVQCHENTFSTAEQAMMRRQLTVGVMAVAEESLKASADSVKR